MKKLEEGHYDGIMLAEAGLQRMKWELDIERLDTDKFCPSANQGTIAVVTPAGSEAETVTSQLNHAQTRIATEIERMVIKDVEGGCTAPIGSFSQFINNDEVRVLAEILSLDGTRQVRIEEIIPLEDHRNHASRLGKELVAMGGKDLVKEAVSKLRINK
jgi:hydroxymethylbilane synthase